MYSPEDIDSVRRDAGFHLEVGIEQAAATPSQPGKVLVLGRVTRVFRARHAIKSGHLVSFWVDSQCGDQRYPPGDDVRLDAQQVAPGNFIEAYFSMPDVRAEGVTLLQVALRQAGVYAVSSPAGRL